jgi:SAM-dependent methyltransferase
MRRWRLIELHEQSWFPRDLRQTVTLLLQSLLNFIGYYRITAPILREAIQRTGTNCVVDLCSGSGGPWFELARLLSPPGQDSGLFVYLTDKFPSGRSTPRRPPQPTHEVAFWTEPVDAEQVPQTLAGLRTIFNSFHHFEPDRAIRILRDAVRHREGIAIFEVPRRDFMTLCRTVLMPLGTYLFLPFVRPFRLSAYFWTYIVPLIPLVMWFDGIVSCLRAYTPRELRQIAEASSHEYIWTSGTLEKRLGFFRIRVTCLLGFPPLSGEMRHRGRQRHLNQVADAARAGKDRIDSIAASSSSSLL